MEDLALFDFDGTITTHETMPVFLRQSISRRRKVIGSVLFLPLVLGYKAGFVSAQPFVGCLYALLTRAFQSVLLPQLAASSPARTWPMCFVPML